MHTEESLMALAQAATVAAAKSPYLGENHYLEAQDALRLAIHKVLAERDSCAEQIAEAVDQRDRQARRAERAEAECERLNGACASYEQQANRDAMEIERLRKLLLRSKRGHYYCEDSWYSCPKEPESGCADESQGTECNCGADEWNAEIDAAMQEGK